MGIRHLDELVTNQPMLVHNCGAVPLVFFKFGGMLGSSYALKSLNTFN